VVRKRQKAEGRRQKVELRTVPHACSLNSKLEISPTLGEAKATETLRVFGMSKAIQNF
jgi:hypothetical protein